jgi:CHAT domain-containing protein/tetratricopeptide (TPR) repeat protein
MLVGPWLLLAAGITLAPTPDSLRRRARGLSDSALVVEVRKDPLAARDAVSDMFAHAVRGPTDAREQEIEVARRVAAAYSIAWHDSLLVRQVARFAAATPQWKAAKVVADSLRRAGVAAYGRRGPRAGIVIWRRALTRAVAIGDTAGAAATSGNIGAAFSRLGQLDSATFYLQRAHRLAADVGDARVQANALAELAGVSEARDSVSAARDGYAKVRSLRERIGDTRGLAADYNNLGLLAERLGDMDEARRDFEAALTLNRREGRAAVAATNLVNLAGLASLTGDFARASSFYREALAIWRANAQWADAADALRGLGQLELRRGDYPAARRELSQALAAYEQSGLFEDALAVRQDLAAALAGAGQLQRAVDGLRQAQRLADSARAPPGIRAGLALARADLAAQLNVRDESERLYASARLLYRQAGDRLGEADAAQGLGLLLLDADDATRARPLLNDALRGEVATGNHRAASITRMHLGELSLLERDTESARRAFSRAAAELERLGDPVASATALGELAALSADGGLSREADSLYAAALARVGDRVAPHLTWRLHAGLGSLREKRGVLDDAARELRAGIADVERASRSLALAERRSGFLSDKSDPYLRLALVERSRGRIGDAFAVSERVRAREMRELLAQGRVTPPADTAAELVAREQDLRRRIAQLTRELAGSAEGSEALRGPDVSRGRDITRELLVSAQAAYSELLLEMRERAPRHAALVSQPPVSWQDVSRKLEANDAFIEYLISDASSIAFVITSDTIASVELGVGRYSLSKSIGFVRGVLQPRGSPRFDALWRAPLGELYQTLIGPLEESGLLAGRTRLTIVPHSDLHYLPFAALLDGTTGRFLVERYEITVTPSAAVWLMLGARDSGHATTGVLALAPRPDALPHSRREVEAIARFERTGSRVLIGSTATEDAFRHEAPNARVVHLATYGILNKANPLFSFVDLAPSATEDGRLEVHDVFGLRLTADLVVLSACQTALGSGAQSDVPAGDDWVGLARAFLHAGASRVVASLWPVQDRATSLLMERFYREYATGAAPAVALALAQRTMLATPGTAHPFYWAAFEVVGQR